MRWPENTSGGRSLAALCGQCLGQAECGSKNLHIGLGNSRCALSEAFCRVGYRGGAERESVPPTPHSLPSIPHEQAEAQMGSMAHNLGWVSGSMTQARLSLGVHLLPTLANRAPHVRPVTS